MFIFARAVTYAARFVALVLMFLPARVLSSSGILRPTAIGIRQVAGMALGTGATTEWHRRTRRPVRSCRRGARLIRQRYPDTGKWAERVGWRRA